MMKSVIVFHDRKMEILVKTGIVVRHYDELMYIVYDAPYCWLHFNDKKYMVETSLQLFMGNLPQGDFFQCNRSVIINTRYYKEYIRADALIVMEDHSEFDLARRRVMAFNRIRSNLL